MLTCRLLFAIAVSCAGCGGNSTPTSGGSTPTTPPTGVSVAQVAALDYLFSPSSISISAGTTVKWTNNGPSTHTSTSDAGVWNSGSISPPSGGGSYGDSEAPGTYQRTFTVAGTFAYHCAFHSQMKATIVVTP